ncbi:MAG: hypothetical protein AB7O96_18005 [Pseudobdellovibrionaceae bacterium]
MNIERTINPVQASFFRSNSTEFNKQKETFHDIFQRTLNSKSSSSPPKIELTGILVPCNEVVAELRFKFKLETDTKEYLLSMSDALSLIAKKAEWDEVTVKGCLSPEGNIFEVEKIFLVQDSQPLKITTSVGDSYFDIDTYKKLIAMRGKIELTPDYLAS